MKEWDEVGGALLSKWHLKRQTKVLASQKILKSSTSLLTMLLDGRDQQRLTAEAQLQVSSNLCNSTCTVQVAINGGRDYLPLPQTAGYVDT